MSELDPGRRPARQPIFRLLEAGRLQVYRPMQRVLVRARVYLRTTGPALFPSRYTPSHATIRGLAFSESG